MSYTKKDYEEQLNEQLESLGYEEALESYIYLTNKQTRGNHCRHRTLQIAVQNNKLGTLLRKYDPIAFYSSYYDTKRNKSCQN